MEIAIGCRILESVQSILDRHPEYIQISASDFHEPEHLARGGIVLNRKVKTSQKLKEALVQGDILERILLRS